MKNLGRIDVERVVTCSQLFKKIGKEDAFTFDFGIDFDSLICATEGYRYPIEGINELADKAISAYCPALSGSISDIAYEFRGVVKNGIVIVRVTCSPSELQFGCSEQDEYNQTLN